MFQTLQVWRGMDPVSRRITHWRNGGKKDVDFVLEWPEGIVALEVKASRSVTSSDADGLRAFRDAVPKGRKFRRGVVLHGGTESRPLGDGVLALPWGKLV